MAVLNQIIAIEKGIKGDAYSELTAINKIAQKPDSFYGIARAYEPLDDDGEKLPSESKRVQVTAVDLLGRAARSLTDLMRVTARKEWSNAVAKADVEVDGRVIVKDAPVTYLLFLEKQLNDLNTFVSNLPTLDTGTSWTRDPNSGLYRSSEVRTSRSKKLQKALVLYQATPEHPAQTQLVTEDILVGYWATVALSGAIPPTVKEALLSRIGKLRIAVKMAREKANSVDEVESPDVGEAVFQYVLGDVI